MVVLAVAVRTETETTHQITAKGRITPLKRPNNLTTLTLHSVVWLWLVVAWAFGA